jgi:hypothetical protein
MYIYTWSGTHDLQCLVQCDCIIHNFQILVVYCYASWPIAYTTLQQINSTLSDSSNTTNKNTASATTWWNYLKKSVVKKFACETICFLMCFQEMSWGKNCFLSTKKPLTIYKRHQVVIDALEIGAVGTDFSKRTSWWARQDPGGAKTWKSIEKRSTFWNVYKYKRKMTNNVSKSYISEWNWVHPEREDDAQRHHDGPGARRWQKKYRTPICQWTNVVEQETSRSYTHKPPNFWCCFKKLLGACPKVEVS